MGKKWCVLSFIMTILISGPALAKDPDVFKLGVMTSFTGPFSGVAETQKKGILSKIDQINKQGGLTMPWGKIRIEAVVKDDKMDTDLGVQLFQDMVKNDGIHALVGSVYNPMAAALNKACKKTGTPYLPSCVPALDSFRKGNPAIGTFSVAFTYTAADVLFQAVEKAGSFDSEKIAGVLSASHFKTVKGDVYFRKDHQMVSKYMAFLVRGKTADERETPSDVFDVVGFFGGEASLPSLESLGY